MKTLDEIQLKALYQNRFPHLPEEIYTPKALSQLLQIFQSILTKRLTWNRLAYAGHYAFGLPLSEFQKPTRSSNHRLCKPQAQPNRNLKRPLKNPKIYGVFSESDKQQNMLVSPDYPSVSTTPQKSIYKTRTQTPNRTRYMHPIFSNSQGMLFRTDTPEGNRENSGCIHLTTPPVTPIKTKKLPRLSEQTFTVTLESIQSHANTPRWPSQQQLTGTTAKKEFEEYNENIEHESGIYFHLSHLIGYFLGGEQTKENLFPGTATSNFNTLKIVERHISNLLTSGKTSAVTLKASPRYEKPHYTVPCEIEFHVSWQEANETKEETIYINPLSFRPVTLYEKFEIDRLRNEADQSNSPNI